MSSGLALRHFVKHRNKFAGATRIQQRRIGADHAGLSGDVEKREIPMRTALLMLLSIATAGPVLAGPTRADRVEPASITCETVRAYVARLGMAQARAMARANGMTSAQERKARQCLSRAD